MKVLNGTLMIMLITIFLGACSQDVNPEISEGEICLKDICISGEWNWVQSSGSIAGALITPETEMLTRKLIIDDTHYSEFINDTLVIKSEYEYFKSDDLTTFSEDSLVLNVEEVRWYGVYERDNNLILIEPCFDCWTHTYSRE